MKNRKLNQLLGKGCAYPGSVHGIRAGLRMMDQG